ncbi:hypothetical protein NC651_001958 [Populus alba x Populus x berolinensis]|nr:hypothetical protein NC651_001958 [Populus alba x Populus x berolinensis]
MSMKKMIMSLNMNRKNMVGWIMMRRKLNMRKMKWRKNMRRIMLVKRNKVI